MCKKNLQKIAISASYGERGAPPRVFLAPPNALADASVKNAIFFTCSLLTKHFTSCFVKECSIFMNEIKFMITIQHSSMFFFKAA